MVVILLMKRTAVYNDRGSVACYYPHLDIHPGVALAIYPVVLAIYQGVTLAIYPSVTLGTYPGVALAIYPGCRPSALVGKSADCVRGDLWLPGRALTLAIYLYYPAIHSGVTV
jgi:hypothetical protein